MESSEHMCAAHAAEAGKVINRRTARANASNVDGWAALLDAAGRIDLPHLPNGLACILPPAGELVYETPPPDELAERARVVVEAAQWFHDRPNDFAVALGMEPGPVVLPPEWLANLPLDISRAGLTDEANQLADALSAVDPARAPEHFGDVTLGLAEGGHQDEARARVGEGLARWPTSMELRTLSAEALATLGDLDGAEFHFQQALETAQDLDDDESVLQIVDRMSETMMQAEPPSPRPASMVRRQPRRKPSRARRKRKRS